MATVRNKVNPQLLDQMLRTEKLDSQCGIVHNATPASKTFSTDVPSVVYLRAQGQTATVDAIETLSWTAPVDNSSGTIFGLYLDIGVTVTPSLGPVPTAENYADKVYSVTVSKLTIDSNGNMISATTLPTTGPGGTTAYLTPLGNIAIEVTDSSGNLATTNENLAVLVTYREQVK
jgi:hypothetical protein